MKQKLLFLVGPTASGKTNLSIKLAKKIKGEIISCDSMQVYKEPRIITNKPTKEQLKKARHHLISIVSLEKEFDVLDFIKLAKRSIKEILKRKKIPILIVGTGFYMASLLDGLIQGVASDKKIRDRLYKEAQLNGNDFLHKRLQKIDPDAAKRIHPNDIKRVIRALEVYEITKAPISKLEKKGGIYNDYDMEIIGIDLSRDELYNRINKRSEGMFKKGLVREVKSLIKSKLSAQGLGILGIKEIKGFLDSQYDLDEAKRLLARNTRHYAKRQLTWFRHEKRIKWMEEGEILKYATNRFNN